MGILQAVAAFKRTSEVKPNSSLLIHPSIPKRLELHGLRLTPCSDIEYHKFIPISVFLICCWCSVILSVTPSSPTSPYFTSLPHPTKETVSSSLPVWLMLHYLVTPGPKLLTSTLTLRTPPLHNRTLLLPMNQRSSRQALPIQPLPRPPRLIFILKSSPHPHPRS